VIVKPGEVLEVVDSYPPVLVPIMSTAAVIKSVFLYTTLLWCLVGSVLVLIRRLRGTR
jgi:hypothetical protein